ncbi:anthrone oxygenase family protein [Actinoplanes awajinensis]|nr:anthrone oxygenase family protein [Actinoplanes awajinensis]
MTETMTTRGLTAGALGGSLLCLGLMAGLFFAFSVAVLPGLHAGDDRTFVAAMQQVNVAIQNGVFGLVFIGALAFPALAAVLLARAGHRSAAGWTAAAAGLYLVVLLLTVTVSVPLNNRLAAAGLTDPAQARQAFAGVWVPINQLRTVLTTLALGCLAPVLVRGAALMSG